MTRIERDSRKGDRPWTCPEADGSTRREFLANVRSATALACAAATWARADARPSDGDKFRAQQSFGNCDNAALADPLLPMPKQNFIGNYMNGLPTATASGKEARS